MNSRRLLFIGIGLLFLVGTTVFPMETAENKELSGLKGFMHLSGGTLVVPGRTFELLTTSPAAGSYGWLLAVGYSTLYAQTALILGLRNARPALKPFLPIPEDRYYLAQSGFTVPVGTAAMGLGFAVSFGLSRAMGSTVEPAPLWAAFNAAIIIPTVVTMWLPETIGGLFAENPTSFMPEWLNNWRQIIGLGWMVALNCVASSVVAGLPWWQSIIAGVVSTAAAGGVMIIFLR